MTNSEFNGGGRVSLFHTLMIGVWFGLMVGLSEIVLHLGRTFLLHRPMLRFSEHVYWMAPLADVALFVSLALLAFLIGSLVPRVRNAATIAMGAAFVGMVNLRPFFASVHWLAWVLLSAGAAVFVGRVISAHERGFLLGVRRSVVGVACVVFGVGAGIPGRHAWREYRASLTSPKASAGSPHVLLLVLDTVRAENLSVYGHFRPTTPNLEKLARQGVCFERALSTAPWTLPSHASLFTGYWPSELSTDWLSALDETYPTLAEWFSQRGYDTAGFVGNVGYCSRAAGLDRGFAHYEDRPASMLELSRSTFLINQIVQSLRRLNRGGPQVGRKCAAQVNRGFLDWLDRRSDRPWFTFINYIDAHAPYLPPDAWRSRFGSVQPATISPSEWAHYSKSELAAMETAYDRSIAYTDDQIGQLLGELERRGALKNTLIVVTADHGEHFGEHGVVLHGSGLYRQLLHVPLLVSWRGRIPEGAVVEKPVSLRNVPATVADLVGGGHAQFPGSSMAPLWNEPASSLLAAEEPIVSECTKRVFVPSTWQISKGDMRSIVVNGFHYIKNGDGSEELYDFMNDVEGERNLVRTDRGRAQLPRFRALLRDLGPRSSLNPTY